MRTCQSCGAQNPPEQDFCSCGEYLRWEPTGYMQAITPEVAAEAAKVSADAAAQVAPPASEPPAPAAPPPPAHAGNGHAQPAAPPPPPPQQDAPPAPPPPQVPAVAQQPPAPIPQPVAKTLVRNAVPAPAAPAPSPVPEHQPATIVLRVPDGEFAKGETLHQSVEPGQRDRVIALIRNQSTVVDNYDLRVDGLPQDWYSVFPSTVYLVPFGSGGTYEQEVEIHLHPPRSPEAEARVWDLAVAADSRALRSVAATAPLSLIITPYVETATTLRPQRKKGRRKADYDVTVLNKGNGATLVALEGEDPDGEMEFAFNRPPHQIPRGAGVTSTMRVRPPKQIWIGRAQDRRFEVKTITGDEAEERAADAIVSAEVLESAPPPAKKKWYKRRAPNVPGMHPPKVFKPQVYPPGMTLGPGGVNVRMPKLQKPTFQAPQMKQMDASQMKLPGKSAAAAAAPLLPTQGVFRQKAWLPWWLIPVLALLLLLLMYIYLMVLPKNVVVPDLVGQKSAFEAEKLLTESDLKLDPSQKTEVKDDVEPGTVIEQVPPKGEEVEKGTQVAILVAVGSDTIDVPDITGMNLEEAEKAVREKGLTLGKSAPPTATPEDKIESQIPPAKEVVKAGTPIDIFYPDPADEETKKKAKEDQAAAGGGGGGGGGDGEGGSGIFVPAVDKADDQKSYAQKLADLGLVPVSVTRFDDSTPGTVFGTEPPGGTPVKEGEKVKLLVSGGQPQVVFTNGKNILRVDAATRAKLDPVASTSKKETDPTWNAAGTHVAYVADGRVMLKDITKKEAKPVALTPEGEVYADLAWAPTADSNVIAMDKLIEGDDTDLCLANVTAKSTDVSCLTEPDFTVGRAIHWAPDGRSILGTAVQLPNEGQFGTVQWKLKKDAAAFSPDASDWSKGKFVTDIETPGKGVLDAAISPDGERIVLVSNLGSSAFRLVFAEKDDFLMSSAKPTSVRACKVAWRGDGQELIVVQGDAICSEDVSTIVRIPANNVRDQNELSAVGDDPTYQPLTPAGG